MSAERWLRLAAQPPHPDHPVTLAAPGHDELRDLLTEYDRRGEVINRVRALGEEIQRQADTNTNAVAPTYLRGVEQARIATRIRRALGDES